jgi:hypothetical protein
MELEDPRPISIMAITAATPITVWMVYAKEVVWPPSVGSPLEWMLLTTVEVSSLHQACERLAWYSVT